VSETTPHLEEVLHLVRDERTRQIQQYGTNDDIELGFGSSVSSYPWLTPFHPATAVEAQRVFRWDYEGYVQIHGKPTWMHLIREEVAELFEVHRREDAIAEAIQVAALCVSLVELLLEDQGELT